MFVNVNKVVCDFVHDCKSECLFLCLEQVHVCLFFYVSCYTRYTCVVVCNKPGGLNVDLFDLLSVVLSVGALCSRTIDLKIGMI